MHLNVGVLTLKKNHWQIMLNATSWFTLKYLAINVVNIQAAVLLKRDAMHGQYACVSIKNVNALRLTDIPTTLKPRFTITCMTSNSKGVMMNN